MRAGLTVLMISTALRERVTEIIEIYDTHAVLPVPIRQLARDMAWDVRFRERMAPLYGWACMENDRPVMGVNASIGAAYQRYVMAHEIGHYLAGHLNDGITRTMTALLSGYSAEESIADAIASLLLIPAYALDDHETTSAVARACEVPPRLVRLRRALVDTS